MEGHTEADNNYKKIPKGTFLSRLAALSLPEAMRLSQNKEDLKQKNLFEKVKSLNLKKRENNLQTLRKVRRVSQTLANLSPKSVGGRRRSTRRQKKIDRRRRQ
jgi:hypothetical protein